MTNDSRGDPGAEGQGHSGVKWALLTVGLFVAAGAIIAYHSRTAAAEERQLATVRAGAIEQSVEEYVSDLAAAAYELAEVARAQHDIEDLEQGAPAILERYRGRVAYLHFQPSGVVTRVFPLDGNEALLGLNVFENPLRRSRAELAVRSRLPTLDGPHPLRQGTGEAVVVRVPIFRRQRGAEEFWGFAGATAYLADLLKAVDGGALERDGYAWALVREDGRRVAGSAAVPADAPVVVTAKLPNDSWTLSLAPRRGWGPEPSEWLAYGALLAFTAVLAALALRVLRLPETLRREVRLRTLALDGAYRERAAIFNAIPDPAWLKDREGRYVTVNAAIGRLAGVAPGALAGKRHGEVFPEGAARVEAHDREVLERGEPVSGEEFVRGSDGSQFWFEVVKHPYRDGTGALVGQVGIARDVTARRNAERALRESEERFRQLVENTNQLFWIAERDARFVYVSPACPRVWGLEPHEAGTRHALRGRVHEDDRARFAAAFDEAARGGADVEYRVAAGGSFRWVRERTFPLRDEAGQVARVAGIVEDVSERRTMEATLRQSQKMEAVGQLAGGVAHDFNNLLCVISASADLLGDEVDSAASAALEVREIADAVKRAKSLTRQLLAFSRRQVLQPRVLRLGEVVGETTKMLRRLIGENIELRVRAADGLWNVRADPGQLEQVIVNLVVNARDAMPNGGELTIAARNAVVDGPLAARHEGAVAGPHVVLEVIDTGCGADAETCARMFEPFFTTKAAGKGTGLGLSTVYGIVKQSGGFIDVTTAPGSGAAFRVFLPRCEEPGEGSRDAPRLPAASPQAGRILLVEDEDAVRNVAARSLRRLGYVVEATASPVAALSLVRGGAPVDLLVTDVVMPAMSGRVLVETLRAEGFAFPVVFMSGNAPGLAELSELPASAAFLEKPFTVDALGAKVLAALGDGDLRVPVARPG